MTMSYPLESGNGPIKSTDTISHGSEGISFGRNGAALGCLSGFAR